MKRSSTVMLVAGGGAMIALIAYAENRNCEPNTPGITQSSCSHSGSSGHGGSGGSGSSTDSTARSGFGSFGSFHGSGS